MRFGAIAISLSIIAATTLIAIDGMSRQHSPAADDEDTKAAARTGLAVIDGDSLSLKGRTVDLAGIDAPEIGQVCDESGHLTTCGLDAAYALRKLLEMETGAVQCSETSVPGRVECFAGTLDVAENLLAQGLAVALPDAPARYKNAESRARGVPLGIWKSTFVMPEEWRLGKRLELETETIHDAEARTELPWRVSGVQVLPEPITHRDPCIIKGTVTASNDRVYFGPLDNGYDSVDASPRNGGRTFCSDDEARLAGWHHGTGHTMR